MADYSEIIFITAAIMIFGTLSLNTSQSFHMTTDTMIRSDLEYRALAIAQDEIDAIRWIQARSKNGPVYPTDPFDPDNSNFLYDNNPETRVITYGSEDQYSESFTITRTAELLEESSDQRRYLITITLENERLSPPLNVSLDFIRTLTFEH